MLSTPENTYSLSQQYRMNAPIMELSNNLVYNNKMISNSNTQKATYEYFRQSYFDKYVSDNSVQGDQLAWITKVASPHIDDSVLFLNTSKLAAYDTRKDGSLVNIQEANIVENIIKMFMEVSWVCIILV